MNAPHNDGDELRLASSGDDDLGLSAEEDRAMYPVHEYIEAAEKPNEFRERPAPTGPQFPFLVGVFEFPFYLGSLAVVFPVSLGMLISGGIGLLFYNYALMNAQAALYFAAGAAVSLILTLGYLFACGQKIIEETSAGYDAIEDWPAALAWKEWAWSLVLGLNYLAQAALVASFLTWFFYFTPVGVLPTVALTYFLFPYIALAGLEDDSWGPTSKLIFKSLNTHTTAWAIFYGEAAAILVAWSIVTLVSLIVVHQGAVLVICPLFTIAAVIYARLMGRLAWCIGNQQKKKSRTRNRRPA